MCFSWNGSQFDTSTMRSFAPKSHPIQGIYWSADGEYVFVVTMDRKGDVAIHRADIPEADLLARQFGISELLGVAA